MNTISQKMIIFDSIKLKVMNVDTVKIELIDWITRLKDPKLINKLLEIKKSVPKHTSNNKVFGSGKQLIGYIADDFNEPLDEFKQYQP